MHLLRLFRDLGYSHVAAIYDGNKTSEAERCQQEFPEYLIEVISTEDIRDKDPVKTRGGVSGMVKKDGTLKNEYRADAISLISRVNDYLSS